MAHQSLVWLEICSHDQLLMILVRELELNDLITVSIQMSFIVSIICNRFEWLLKLPDVDTC
jgi:hypothetical protein